MEEINDIFIECEKRFPLWLMAKPIISSLIPDKLEYIVDKDSLNNLVLDKEWAEQIISLAPKEDRKEGEALFSSLDPILAKYFLEFNFDRFLSMPLNDRTLSMVNTALIHYEDARLFHRKAPISEILKHHLGVEYSFTVIQGGL